MLMQEERELMVEIGKQMSTISSRSSCINIVRFLRLLFFSSI